MGIGDYPAVLAISLGAGDTTVLRLTNAYAMLANQGRALKPTLIDYVQDRHGKVICRADTRPCEGCNAKDWDGKPMPRPRAAHRSRLMDAMTAYQIVHILEGVVQRGTATDAARSRPAAVRQDRHHDRADQRLVRRRIGRSRRRRLYGL